MRETERAVFLTMSGVFKVSRGHAGPLGCVSVSDYFLKKETKEKYRQKILRVTEFLQENPTPLEYQGRITTIFCNDW